MAQNIDVEGEQFPGAKRVKVESFGRGPKGFWAVYQLDGQGRALERRGYLFQRHTNTEQYVFTHRNQLLQTTVTTLKQGQENKRTQVFRNNYQYSPDSARIIREVNFVDNDTMCVTHNLGFDVDNHPTKFTTKCWKVEGVSEKEATYTAGRLASFRRTELSKDGEAVVYEYTYEYNSQGDPYKKAPISITHTTRSFLARWS